MPRGTPSTLSTPVKVFLKRMKQKRLLKKKIKKTKKSKKSLKKIKKLQQNRTNFFFIIFRNCPKKGAQGDAVHIVSPRQSVFEEDKAEEAAESS